MASERSRQMPTRVPRPAPCAARRRASRPARAVQLAVGEPLLAADDRHRVRVRAACAANRSADELAAPRHVAAGVVPLREELARARPRRAAAGRRAGARGPRPRRRAASRSASQAQHGGAVEEVAVALPGAGEAAAALGDASANDTVRSNFAVALSSGSSSSARP